MGKPLKDNGYRYERKYNFNIDYYEELIYKLKLEKFSVHHPPRTINNLYFDTLDCKAYFENVEGESIRNKYRLRWYGERFQNFESTFEVKMKQDTVNKKKSIKLSKKFNLSDYSQLNKLYDFLLNELFHNDLNLYNKMFSKMPILLNGYDREYYISIDRETRLTIDRNLFFYNNATLQQKHIDDKMIVEVKYPSYKTPDINFDELDLRLGKRSKFVSGIDLTSL